MDTIHPQVPVLDFECDEEIAELITLMNNLGIVTLLSCQDIPVRRGNVPGYGYKPSPRFCSPSSACSTRGKPATPRA
jgi:hypothetical protein